MELLESNTMHVPPVVLRSIIAMLTLRAMPGRNYIHEVIPLENLYLLLFIPFFNRYLIVLFFFFNECWNDNRDEKKEEEGGKKKKKILNGKKYSHFWPADTIAYEALYSSKNKPGKLNRYESKLSMSNFVTESRSIIISSGKNDLIYSVIDLIERYYYLFVLKQQLRKSHHRLIN